MEKAPNHSKGPQGNLQRNILNGLRAALLAALPIGCSAQLQVDRTSDNELVAGDQSGRKVKRLIESDSGTGKVVHIRNWHGEHFKKDETSLEDVTEYQMRAFEDYLYAKPKAILAEINHYRESTAYLEDECWIRKNGEEVWR